MSRTYRRSSGSDGYLYVGFRSVLRDLDWTDYPNYKEVWIPPNCPEGKKRLKQYKSDSGHGWHDSRGPSWFLKEYMQVPYRARAKQEISKWKKDPEHEILLESKPSRDYWD